MIQHAVTLIVAGVLFCVTPICLARSAGAITEADFLLWWSRQDFGRRLMLALLAVSGSLFVFGGALLLLGELQNA